jgi:outer membrane protein OmpA-like peptidoglycan-associated protein
MDDTKKPAPRSSMSRTVVTAVVGLLIVIAIAGIVLASRKASQTADPTASSSSTPGASTAPTSGGSPAAATAPDPLPSAVRFAGSNDTLPPEASGDLARFADAVRAGGQQVGLTARFVAGSDKQAALDLGRKRVEAVQHALQSNGISASRIQAEMIEVPAATQPAANAGRVELSLR